MDMIKKCLKSWIFWLILSVIIFVVGVYYREIVDNSWWGYDYYDNCIHSNCIHSYPSYDYYDENFFWLILVLLMVSNIMCLVNLSRKDGIRRLLTVTICSFAIFLFLSIGYEEDLFDYDILESISMLSFFFVFMPAWTLTLLRLVRKNKNNGETENDKEKINVTEEENLGEKVEK